MERVSSFSREAKCRGRNGYFRLHVVEASWHEFGHNEWELNVDFLSRRSECVGSGRLADLTLEDAYKLRDVLDRAIRERMGEQPGRCVKCDGLCTRTEGVSGATKCSTCDKEVSDV